MNSWLTNFIEYKGILNPLCISCRWCAVCKEDELLLEEGFCNGKDYVKGYNDETKNRT